MGDTGAFDDDARSPEEPDPSLGSEHLLELLTDLRRRLEAVAPVGEDPRPDATELIRQAQERIASLEQMLEWARARERELTARSVRGEMRVAHVESTFAELNAIAKRVSEAESGRLGAETKAAELQQHLTAARTEIQSRDAEVRRLNARLRELESDLARLADELASATLTRVTAERLERERDVALDRAREESGLALDARLRAADAERQLDELRDRLRDIEDDEDYLRREEEEAEYETTEDEAVVNLTQEPGGAEYEDDEDDEDYITEEQGAAEYRAGEDDAVVDLTQQPGEAQDEAFEDDEVIVWGEPARPGGVVGWLRRGMGSDHPDEPSDDRG
jgi:chromosome segregation ATPase